MNLVKELDTRTNRVRLYPDDGRTPPFPKEPLYESLMHIELMTAEIYASEWALRNGHRITLTVEV